MPPRHLLTRRARSHGRRAGPPGRLYVHRPYSQICAVRCAQFPALVKLTETMHGQIAEWLGLPPMRSSPMRPQSAQARRTGRHTALKASGSDGTLLNKTVASELERVNETLREEHAAMHKHVGALEGEISAMRAELQELRKEMLVGSDKGVIGKMGSSVSGGLGRASSMFFGQQERQHAGTITVRVLRATDLVAADKGGKSDPYMVVQAADVGAMDCRQAAQPFHTHSSQRDTTSGKA